MKQSEHMEIKAGYAHYAPKGVVTLEEGIALVTEAIRFCRFQKISRLLVDSTGLTGFPPPLIHERYWSAQEWAHAAKGALDLAMVAKEENLDPQRFGVLVAKNAGLNAHASSSLEECLAWLLAQPAR